MSGDKDFWKKRVQELGGLDITDRLSEVLFGLIMVLSFTGTISVSTAGEGEVSQLLWAALGCNLAWGLVDAIMYLMDLVLSRGHDMAQIRKMRNAGSKDNSRKIFREIISPLISDIMKDEEIDQLGNRLRGMPEPSIKNTLTVKDLLSSVEIFFLVFLSTFPVAIPFIIFSELPVAMRASNGIALILLFAGGYMLARYAGFRPVITALIYTGIGLFLVSLTIALGG